MKISFSEYRPSPPLDTLVQTYWTGDFNLYAEKGFSQSVLPNGCVELIIHLGHDHCELVKEESWEKSPEFTLIGLQTAPYEVRFNSLVRVFGIRFNPEGIFSLFGVPPALFTATYENSREVLGRDFDDYCSRMRDAESIRERIQLTESFLMRHVSEDPVARDYSRMAFKIIRKHQGNIGLDDLIRQLPVSPRQLQRTFRETYGITAKEYMRLCRLNAIQQYFQGRDRVNLTELSYERGFADQSHFIREYRLLTGTNPGGFLKGREQFITRPARHS